jgi:hypothetical protein
MEFPVCYRSPKDVFAASCVFLHLRILRFKENKKKKKQRRRWQSREVCSGSSLLAGLNFQLVSGL